MITAEELAGALAKCVATGVNDYINDEDPSHAIVDGHFNLERAAKLLNRLERMRRKRSRRTCPYCGELLTIRNGRFVVHHGPGQDTRYCRGSGTAPFDRPATLSIKVDGEVKGEIDAPRAWIKGVLSDPDD